MSEGNIDRDGHSLTVGLKPITETEAYKRLKSKDLGDAVVASVVTENKFGNSNSLHPPTNAQPTVKKDAFDYDIDPDSAGGEIRARLGYN